MRIVVSTSSMKIPPPFARGTVMSGLWKASVKWARSAGRDSLPACLKLWGWRRDGQIFVHGKDQITRLIDFNNDGEADLYEL